jgi:hypothetical protein
MRLFEQGRTRLLGAAIGTCLVTAVGVTGAFAQDATPEPSTQSTPAAGTAEATPEQYRATAAERTALAEQVQHVTDTIATVQADRDAVGGTGDWTAVDDLLAKANQLRDAAKATLETDDLMPARQQLGAAEGAAMAAEALIRAQLSDYGLPSQQAGASRALVAAYNQIHETSDRVNAGTDDNAKAFATTAQGLYQTAYDLYNAGTYAQAARTAEVALQVAGLADILGTEFTIGTASGGANIVPANGQDVVVIEGGTRDGGFGRGGRDERGEVKRGGEPAIEVRPGFQDGGEPGFTVEGEPGFSGVITLEPAAGTRAIGFGGSGIDDFSTDSPLEVPAPDFD